MNGPLESRDGEFVRRIQARLRGDERPRTNPRILSAEIRDSKLNSGNHCEQREFKN